MAFLVCNTGVKSFCFCLRLVLSPQALFCLITCDVDVVFHDTCFWLRPVPIAAGAWYFSNEMYFRYTNRLFHIFVVA